MSVNPRDGSYNVPGAERREDFNDVPEKAPRHSGRWHDAPSKNFDDNPLTPGTKELWRDDFGPWTKEPQDD